MCWTTREHKHAPFSNDLETGRQWCSNQAVARVKASASTRMAAARYTLSEAASFTRDAKLSKISVS
jgi:hypothetical protein